MVGDTYISPAFRLGTSFYRLARGDHLHKIAEMTRMVTTTVWQIVLEVSMSIVNRLWQPSVMKLFPSNCDEYKECITDFDEIWQFPYCLGAIDSCHIPIKCPVKGIERAKEYHNFKNFHSVLLMAIVDAKHRFVWASSGYPGNSHDAIIFESTTLYSRITDADIIPTISKQQVGCNIIGDSAFPFTTWPMKPFSHAVLSPQQRYLNYR